MAISLDLSDAEEARILRAFAPWTIHAEVYSLSGEVLATFHDSGTTVSAALTSDEVAALSAVARPPRSPDVDIVPLDEWTAARKAAKRAARGALFRRLLRRA